jgi:hypothetical protein
LILQFLGDLPILLDRDSSFLCSLFVASGFGKKSALISVSQKGKQRV